MFSNFALVKIACFRVDIMDKKTIVVVGAGQGLGNHVAKRFGKEGFRVVLMARDGNALKRYQQEFADEGIETFVHEADAEKTETLDTAFGWLKQQFGTPDVLVYNVGITAADEPGKMTNAELMRHYQVDVASAWHCARLVADDDFGKKQGVILFTGGGLGTLPASSFTPLSIDKAALRALACMLHDELKAKGIFVGTVTVYGPIGIGTYFAPARIAETYWRMYRERGAWEVRYEYPEMQGSNLSPQDYWTKVYGLTEKYK